MTLPPRGKALILSDLHGHLGDWTAFLTASELEARLEAGEDLWLLITGDVPDVTRHRAVDPSVPEDGDVQVLDRIMALKARLGPRAERVVYLEGNHDFHLARLAREVVRYHASRVGERPPAGAPRFTDAQRLGYCSWYLETYGEAVYQNNVGPYDMLARIRPEQVEFLEAAPILAVCAPPAPGATGLLVTHAGPPRMHGLRPAAVKREIERADREELRRASPEAYYASPYHQLLNNRFRNGDYGLDDVRAFLDMWDAGVLVTGHTPHPYLVDFERRCAYQDCAFQDGLGLIGPHQVVLCSSFGAFSPGLKRWLEVDLARPHPHGASLLEQGEVRSVYPESAAPVLRPLPGAELVLGAPSEQDAPFVRG